MLSQSCATLAGVGPVLLNKLHKCGIQNVADLLFYLPYRYQDRTRVTAIQDIRASDYCVILGQITSVKIKKAKRPMLYCTVADKTGLILLRFFHFNRYHVQSLAIGRAICAFGEIRQFANQLTMVHPDYHLQENSSNTAVAETLTPIYPTTQGLTQSRLRQLVTYILTQYQSTIDQLEWMTTQQLSQLNFISFSKAINLLHNPPPDVTIQSLENGQHPALRRIAFDELIAQRLTMQLARQHRAHLHAPKMIVTTNISDRFLASLAYPLTAAQHRVSTEISHDLAQDKPMLRLLQGDVGCGKTTVAVLAALQAIQAGFQVALMVPTDLLSEQHATVITHLLSPLGICCLRLSGKLKTRARREILAQIIDQRCHLLIGTHALFQEKVIFKRLGLIIIDEQHRFGVEQRKLLQQKGQLGHLTPHQLLMTATPIPRTLAMTQLAHLDISIIDELPPGRIPIETAVINCTKRALIIDRLQHVISQGRQAYWVCTLVEESELLQCQAATVTAQTLQQQLDNVRVGLVHGKMKPLEKEAVMLAFKQGKIDLLVATTVIEVGVDVANASLMIIENAERLGLAQLHQLRGRVGRGNMHSYCILVYQSPLTYIASQRLQVMRSTTDGFVIAEFDLGLRGSGEILGTRQTGYKQLRVANLERDASLLPKVASIALLLAKQHPELAQRIIQQWFGKFEQFLSC